MLPVTLTAEPVATGGPGLGLAVTAVVLAAAVIHATWNALIHAVKDRVLAFALLGLGSVLVAGPAVPFVPPLDPAAWPYVAVSTVLHLGYFALLLLSYRIGEFSQVYPLARGTAPWLVAVAAALFVGERLGPWGVVGVLLISAGLASLVFAGRRPDRSQLPALAAAGGTGLAIATYTVVDGLGVRRAGDATAYAAWLFLIEGTLYLLGAGWLRRRELTRQRGTLAVGLLCGVLSALAYGLVLWAQTHGALAAVAALRETSVIAGAAIGAVFFHERFGRPRILAATLVAAGVVLLNLPA